MRFGVNTWFWVWHFTTENLDLVEKVAGLGFDWIEIPIESIEQPIDCREVRAAIQDNDLGVSVCALFNDDCDFVIEDAALLLRLQAPIGFANETLTKIK